MKRRPAFAAALAVMLSTSTSLAQPRHSPTPLPPGGPKVGFLQLAPAGEPGPPMEVSGVVVDRAGKPVAGARMRVYQADAKGLYSSSSDLPPRLAGYVNTDSAGRYRIRTIRPTGYGGFAAHIHFVIERGFSREALTSTAALNEEVQFADDPVQRGKGRAAKGDLFATVQPVTKGKDGVQRVRRDFRLE